ncbi:hypothetical protein ABPG72_005861 [Tetrahymena utriculariae]
MRFQFCGGLSIPEWFLAESSNLAKITAIKLKLVLNALIQHYLEDTDNSDQLVKTLENSGFNSQEINAIIASLEFIIKNSVCYDIDENVLSKELIDLGFPKENVEMIIKTFRTYKDKLKLKELKSTLRISNVQDLKYSVNKFILSKEKQFVEKENRTNESLFSNVQIKYNDQSQRQSKTVEFIAFPSKLEELIFELEKAQQILNKY